MTDRPPRILIAASLVAALVLQLVELPYVLAALRPMLVPLVLVYWVMVVPQPTGLLTAWVVGLLLDVLLGSVLGAHALGLTIMVFVTLQVRGILSLYPIWQEALALVPIWMLYAFIMFWIDGATGHRADPWLQWLPIVTTGLCWPPVFALMNTIASRSQRDPLSL
ncbi:MAG: rod shape-determining protein MreD [Gammaproteobacteria bacterium]